VPPLAKEKRKRGDTSTYIRGGEKEPDLPCGEDMILVLHKSLIRAGRGEEKPYQPCSLEKAVRPPQPLMYDQKPRPEGLSGKKDGRPQRHLAAEHREQREKKGAFSSIEAQEKRGEMTPQDRVRNKAKTFG